MTRAGAEPYVVPVRGEIGRLLSLGDREPCSRTYGCFDRVWWCWKFTDFPGSRFQEAAFPLAWLYRSKDAAGPLGGDERLLRWAVAAADFWTRLQHADGSFDEAYPYEHSLAAAAFTCFYLGEAFLLLEDVWPRDSRQRLIKAFERAGDWLCSNDEKHGILTNHLAAAAAACDLVGRITRAAKYTARSQHFLRLIYDHQSDEGWYREYGGADPGYQTHATFYLARLWQRTKDRQLYESLARSVEFLKHFVHPNGSIGGEYASRNTEFYFPAGFEILAPALGDAGSIVRFMRRSISTGSAAGLGAMDSYNYLPMLNNYLFAADNLSPDPGTASLPFDGVGERLFTQAGLYVKCTRHYYSVTGLSKGGVFRVYSKGPDSRLIASDCGYVSRMTGHGLATSQSQNAVPGWREIESGFVIDTEFARMRQRTQSPSGFLAFRLVSLTVGRWRRGAYLLKSLLVRLLIRHRRAAPLNLSRRIQFRDDRVVIEDVIRRTGRARVLFLGRGQKFSTIHMGSSRYFQPQEFDQAPQTSEDLSQQLMTRGSVTTVIEVRPGASSEGQG